MTKRLDGKALAGELRTELTAAVETLHDAGVTPTLATVLMSDDSAAATYVEMKQQDCAEVGIETIDPEIEPTGSQQQLHELIDKLNADPSVNGILVQLPLPDQIDQQAVLQRIDPRKDVDGFHPENVGRLVGGAPRFKPCTPHGIQKLLAAGDIDPQGAHAVVVGRSEIVGKPMANLLLQDGPGGNATVTVCHSNTENLAEHTRSADILIVAVGVPEFIDGSMVTEGTVIVDVGINRVTQDGETQLVGDVDHDAVDPFARAITPVPGGVGPMTRAMLLYNTIKATSQQHEIDIEVP